MKRNYWLPLSLFAVAAALSVACSPKFTACDGGPACSSGGAGGMGLAGSASTGQAGDNGSPAGDAGSAGEAGSDEPVLFGACSQLGQTACTGYAKAQRLGCDGSHWLAGLTCAAGELCDSTSGECAKVVPECAGGKAGNVVCRGDGLLTCGVDLVTALEGEACVGLCKDGACQEPICGDHKVEPGEDCDDGEGTSGGCVKCKAASCGDGAIYPAKEQCDDSNKVAGDGCSATCSVEPIAIALGGDTTCALSANGRVKCWGRNDSGVLGMGDTKSRGELKSQVPSKLQPIDLGKDRTATAISVSSGNSACALLDHGEVKCWGNNQFGQLGTGTKDNRGDEPGEMGDALKPIMLGAKAMSISAGYNYTCAVLENGNVKCWGSGAYGQLGLDSANDVIFPEQFTTIGLKVPAKAVSASDGVTCALLVDGTVKCWGNAAYLPVFPVTDIDSSQSIGDYPGEISNLPALTFSGGKAISVVAGHVSEAILENGSLMLWGYGYQAWTQSGLTPEAFAVLPAIKMAAGKQVTSSDVDLYHACVTANDGVVSCWGYAPHGALGLGSDVSATGPIESNTGVETRISVDLGGRAAKQVAVGQEHSCALLDDGTLKCWGYNASGQLGLGDNQNRGDSGEKLNADTTVDLAL